MINCGLDSFNDGFAIGILMQISFKGLLLMLLLLEIALSIEFDSVLLVFIKELSVNDAKFLTVFVYMFLRLR